MGRRRDRGVSLTRGSLILFAVAVVLAGFAGVGIGYKVEQNRTNSVKTATAADITKHTRATPIQRMQNMRTCLAGAGLRWPKIAGKFLIQLRTPPPGVSEAQRINALIICYVATVAGTRPGSTTGVA